MTSRQVQCSKTPEAGVRLLPLVALLSSLVTLAGCSESGKTPDEPEASPALAVVGDQNITERDVSFMLEHRFDQSPASADEALREKVLESLIASRAMRQLAEAQLSDAEQERLRAKVRAYEEELYVQAYLQENTEPQPVTGEMVRNYYNGHPEQFGAETLRRFELLVAPPNLEEERQAALLSEVPDIRAAEDWSESVSRWRERYGLRYQSGKSRQGLLEPALDSALASLEEGETSSVLYLDGQLHLLRLTGTEQTAPRPLSAVRDEIRRKLSPLHLKEAVRSASEQARSQVDTKILSDNEQ